MSRNRTLREIASKLPDLPKLTADNKLVYDTKGKPVMRDHFREMVEIKNEIENAYPRPTLADKQMIRKLQIQAVANYSIEVEEKARLLAAKRRIKYYKIALMALFWTGLAIYIAIKYF
jgi:hypothetical protein